MKVGLVFKNGLTNSESGPEYEPLMEFLPEITSAGVEVILPAASRSHPFPRTATWACAGHAASRRRPLSANDVHLFAVVIPMSSNHLLERGELIF
jgi:hypothetical protein